MKALWLVLTIIFGLNTARALIQFIDDLFSILSEANKVQNWTVWGVGSGGQLIKDGVVTLILFFLAMVCWRRYKRSQALEKEIAPQIVTSKEIQIPPDSWKCRCGAINSNNDNTCPNCKREHNAIY